MWRWLLVAVESGIAATVVNERLMVVGEGSYDELESDKSCVCGQTDADFCVVRKYPGQDEEKANSAFVDVLYILSMLGARVCG